jgi:hypothetical protein
MSARQALKINRATSSRVIVILRNQYLAIPATKRRIGARVRAERLGNTRILSQVRRSGGHVYRTYHALNAFAATVSKNERSALQKDAAVKQVVPDTIVQLPAPINARSVAATKRPRAGLTTPSRCSSLRLCRPRTRRSTTPRRPRRRTSPAARA